VFQAFSQLALLRRLLEVGQTERTGGGVGRQARTLHRQRVFVGVFEGQQFFPFPAFHIGFHSFQRKLGK